MEFFVIWVGVGVPGTGLEKDAENVRNETLQNLENCVPVYTGAQFSFSPRHPQIVDFELIYAFIGDPLANLYSDFRCFFLMYFLDWIYE